MWWLRCFGVPIVMAVSVLAAAPAAHAVSVCTAAQVSAADAGCPVGSGPCNITHDFDIPNNCTLDFGGRAVTLVGKELTIGSGSVTIRAGTFTITPGGLINGRGEDDTGPTSVGGTIRIETLGDVSIERASAHGRIDVSAKTAVGTMRILSGGTATLAGTLRADKLGPAGSGGLIQIYADGDVLTLADSSLTAVTAGGTSIDLKAGGRVDLGEKVDVSGGSGGSLSALAGGEIVLRKILANGTGEAGDGGTVSAIAGTHVQLLGDILANGNGSADGSGGYGGEIDLESEFGDLTIAGLLKAEGALADGDGGFVTLTAAGALVIQSGAAVSGRANGGQGYGGDLELTAQSMTLAGTVDASGGGGGGVLSIFADGAVAMSGTIFAGSVTDASDAGSVDIEAGALSTGDVLVSGTIDATGGGCDTFGSCGAGGDVSLIGCDVTLTSTAQLIVQGGNGGTNTLTARDQLSVSGLVDARRKPASTAGADGANTLNHPTGKPPTVTPGSILPTALTFARPTCTSFLFPLNCLDGCPTCGNGAIEYPETCDGGNAVSCDGCSAFCRLENCTDGLPCTSDLCDPQLGCGHPQAPNDTPCPDALACNGTETCQAGVCTAGTAPNCNDGTSCTVDSCVEPGGCAHVPVAAGTPCTDNSLCTTGTTCDASGVCGTVVVCNDTNECTNDSCNPLSGCVFQNRTGACTDDGNACTDDQCNGGSCLHPNRPNGTTCSDGAYCTVNDSCQGGSCLPGPPRSCADTNVCTADSCNESGDTCVNTPVTPCCGNGVTEPGEQCDDGNTVNGDGCSNTCQLLAGCGDGVRQGAEECDAGPANANTPDAPCRLDCRLPACGDSVTDPGRGEQCDDGGTSSGDGCSFRCYLEPPPTAGYVAGKGDVITDCVTEWAIDQPDLDRNGQPSVKQTCKDGDPSCDAGSTAGECTIHVWLCANVVDPRFPSCTPADSDFGTVAFVEVRKPNDKDALKRPEDAANQLQLRRAAEASTTGLLGDCGPRLAVRVPLKTPLKKGSKALKVRSTTTRVLFDSDTLKLVCEP